MESAARIRENVQWDCGNCYISLGSGVNEILEFTFYRRPWLWCLGTVTNDKGRGPVGDAFESSANVDLQRAKKTNTIHPQNGQARFYNNISFENSEKKRRLSIVLFGFTQSFRSRYCDTLNDRCYNTRTYCFLQLQESSGWKIKIFNRVLVFNIYHGASSLDAA